MLMHVTKQVILCSVTYVKKWSSATKQLREISQGPLMQGVRAVIEKAFVK